MNKNRAGEPGGMQAEYSREAYSKNYTNHLENGDFLSASVRGELIPVRIATHAKRKISRTLIHRKSKLLQRKLGELCANMVFSYFHAN